MSMHHEISSAVSDYVNRGTTEPNTLFFNLMKTPKPNGTKVTGVELLPLFSIIKVLFKEQICRLFGPHKQCDYFSSVIAKLAFPFIHAVLLKFFLWVICSFIHSFIHSFIYLFMYLSINSFCFGGGVADSIYHDRKDLPQYSFITCLRLWSLGAFVWTCCLNHAISNVYSTWHKKESMNVYESDYIVKQMSMSRNLNFFYESFNYRFIWYLHAKNASSMTCFDGRLNHCSLYCVLWEFYISVDQTFKFVCYVSSY